MRQLDELAEAERLKYERSWTYEDYRMRAPGEAVVDDAIAKLGMEPPETIIDYGCGTGRPAQRFVDYGFRARGVDIAKNCLDEGVNFPFIQSCLWDMPVIDADWSFCTDVMEHIPPDRVESVLMGIAARTERGAYFQIYRSSSKHHGVELHLTQRPPEWWRKQMIHWFSEVEIDESLGNNHRFVAICRSH